MSDERTRATLLTVVLPGLVGGGLCGAAVGAGWVSPTIGVLGALALGLCVGWMVLRTRRRFSRAKP